MTKYIPLKQNAQGGLSDLTLLPSALGTTTPTLRAGVLLTSLLVPEQRVFFGPLSGMFFLQNLLQTPLLLIYLSKSPPLQYAPESRHSSPHHTHPVGMRVLSHRFISDPQHYHLQHVCPNPSTTPHSSGRPQSPAQCPAWTVFDEAVKECIHDNATERSGRRLEEVYVNWKGKLGSPCTSLKDQPLKLLVRFFCIRHTPPMSIQQRIPSTAQW